MELVRIIEELKKNELFWRISRTDTFIDLLMLQYHNVVKNGLSSGNAYIIIQTAIKAIVNYELGTINVTSDYKKTIHKLDDDRKRVMVKIDLIVQNAIAGAKRRGTTAPLPMLQYFMVLNSLDLSNYEVDIFYDILIAVINSDAIETNIY